mgnify:CR=1 FL=1
MPPYNLNQEDLINEVLANLAAQRQSPPQQSVLGARMTLDNPQTQNDPMTDATLEGLRQNGGNIPQQQPVLDGISRRYAGDITAQKMAYAAAQNDAQRQAASMNADMLRQAAQGAGMDLSGYGNDVSLQDAMQNLQTNDARALVEMFQGKYAKSSDDFYNDKFRELVNGGMPVGRARRAAGEFARQYQGERVNYLQGMLQGYGFDGRVVTPVGQQIVGQIAAENPQLANMYLNANPGQKDAYNTDNQMAMAAMQNQGAMDRLMQEYLNGFGERADVYKYNTMGKYTDSDIRMNEYGDKQNLDFADAQRRFSQDRVNQEKAFRDNVARAYEWGSKIGYKGKDLELFTAKAIGYPIKGSQKLDIEPLQKYFKQISDNYNKTLEQLEKAYNEDERQLLLNNLNDMQTEMDEIRAMQRNIFGINLESTENLPQPEYVKGNDAKNIEGAAAIFKYAANNGMTLTAAQDAVKKWAMAQGASETEANQIVQKALNTAVEG